MGLGLCPNGRKPNSTGQGRSVFLPDWKQSLLGLFNERRTKVVALSYREGGLSENDFGRGAEPQRDDDPRSIPVEHNPPPLTEVTKFSYRWHPSRSSAPDCTGRSKLDSGEHHNIWVRKYSPVGDTLWTRTFSCPSDRRRARIVRIAPVTVRVVLRNSDKSCRVHPTQTTVRFVQVAFERSDHGLVAIYAALWFSFYRQHPASPVRSQRALVDD